ncbi:MAG: hypothetical protein A3A86_00690 [Elusimicrobia bacterium RIFCSPLOWO2_01_FULL_60_11]|nr:MAG: hypothetical protein A3A86_00690 [Elusimicrobia bacterium RIFCSPLOWO2_01_FULL_60_11]
MKRLFLAAVITAGVLSQTRAISFSEWIRTSGVFQKKRSVKTRQTMVAAVRGVEAPGDVDPQARDYEGVEKMEARQASVKDPGADFPKETQEEIEIGRDVAANVIAQFGLYEDEALADYVNAVGQSVARYAPRQDIPYRFAVIKSDILNAFAAPGGYIFITTGLLKSLKDEAQLAGVLAHEVTHVSQRHVMKEIRKVQMVNSVIPGYVRATAEKAGHMKQVTDLAVKIAWKGLSREDELEADRLALDYARAAGYDPSSFKEVLEMLRDRAQTPKGLEHDVKFILSTHPRPQDRILAVNERLKFFMIGGTKRRDEFERSVKFQK